jgi:hypothetical protein
VTLLAGPANGATGAELIRFFGHARQTGTLVLRSGGSSRYCLFEEGRVRFQRDSGTYDFNHEEIDAYTWLTHEHNELPWLTSKVPHSSIAALRALPHFGHASVLLNTATDLPTLLDVLRMQAFTGAITLEHGQESGIALLTDGLIRAAAFERDGYTWHRVDALRALQRHSLQTDLPPLRLLQLDDATALGLAGVALDARAGSDDLTDYSGVSSSDSGYTFHLDGKPYLQVRVGALLPGVRYAQPESLPDLRLPSGTPGWERLKYDLTLRGRDALIPMTELAMEFDERFGNLGRKVLTSLQQGLNVEEVSARLQLDLGEVRSSLERLEKDGMIRARK